MQVDHVLLMTRDVEACADRLLAEHDLGSVAGGEHPAWGTANRIVPAGFSYLEIMGPADLDRAARSELGRFVLDASAQGDRLSLVCLRVDDLEPLARRLGLSVEERSRVRPDGSTLTWRMAGLEEALAEGMPFFIEWAGATGAEVPDPVRGRRARALSRVELGGDAERLHGYLGAASVAGLDLVGGERGVRSALLAVAGGEVELR